MVGKQTEFCFWNYQQNSFWFLRSSKLIKQWLCWEIRIYFPVHLVYLGPSFHTMRLWPGIGAWMAAAAAGTTLHEGFPLLLLLKQVLNPLHDGNMIWYDPVISDCKPEVQQLLHKAKTTERLWRSWELSSLHPSQIAKTQGALFPAQ